MPTRADSGTAPGYRPPKKSTAKKAPAKSTKKAASGFSAATRHKQAAGQYVSPQRQQRANQTQRAASGAQAQRAWAGEAPPVMPSNNSPSIEAIMAASGSTDPNDPHNWAAIRRALDAQAASRAEQGSGAGQPYVGGSSGGGGSAPPAPPTPIVQPPSQYVAPPAVQAPTPAVAQAPAAAVSGKMFSSAGRGSFGSFDRLRNQRTPKSGLSVTPEMLRAAAQARMGTGAR